MEKTHDEQVTEFFGYIAEVEQMRAKNYINPARLEYIMAETKKLTKALRHYPDIKVPFFSLVKNLLLESIQKT